MQKISKLYHDKAKCPVCHQIDVMFEYEDDKIVERYCTVCDYTYKFEKRLMRD